MTSNEFKRLLSQIQQQELAVCDDGQKEYAHSADNCFGNFDSDSDHGVSRLQSITTLLNKHMRGIKAFVNGHRSQREDIRGRIKDARLYLALLWAAINDDDVKDPEYCAESQEKGGHYVLTGARYTDLVLPDDRKG